MECLSTVINENLEEMVNAEDRCVELTSAHKDLLTVACIEDNGSLDELIAEDMTCAEYEQFQADMAKDPAEEAKKQIEEAGGKASLT